MHPGSAATAASIFVVPSSSRAKRKRAAVRSAKRSRTNTWWYALTAIVVVAGVALIIYARSTAPAAVGPFVANQNNPTQKDTHWHTALGVYNCDHWMGDSTGTGIWNWPTATPSGSPARADNPQVYAGMHSHDDGIIHMEPLVSSEAGKNATVGLYFDYGGWKLSSDGFTFLGQTVKNGDKCGSSPGTLSWATGKWDGTSAKQNLTVQSGNPAKYKLNNDGIVVIAFLPPGKTIAQIGNPPSLPNLAKALNVETPPGQMPTGTTAPTGVTPTTARPSTATSNPAGATPTSKP
jgi:hypothetical protein